MAAVSVPRPLAVLLDWDNTLADNWRAIQAALNVALEQAGLPPMELDQVKFQGRHSARDIFPRLFGENWQPARDTFYAHLAEHHLAGLRVMPGADALLAELRGRGVKLAIVSNKKGDLLRREIAHLSWSEYFASVVGAQDAEADKPHPAPVLMALEAMGLSPSHEIWLVGDTDIDMKTAVAAGCLPVLVAEEPVDAALLAGAEPALRCHNCDELVGFVQRLCRTISV
jgi:phosphoglycolate phosphatase